jgi:hypothetical protein
MHGFTCLSSIWGYTIDNGHFQNLEDSLEKGNVMLIPNSFGDIDIIII